MSVFRENSRLPSDTAKQAAINTRYSMIVNTNCLEKWLECLSSANVIVVANPASLYPCAPSFMDMVVMQSDSKSWDTLSPYVFSCSPRLRLSLGERSKNLGANSRPKPFSQPLVIGLQ